MSLICASCTFRNHDGAVFCNQCGIKLISGEDSPTEELTPSTQQLDFSRPLPPLPPEAEEDVLGLYLLEEKILIELEEKEITSLGRVSADTSTLQDVNLELYHGFSKGVSRKHAIIHNHSEGIFISDLRTSNGTYVNQFRLKPHERVPLKHGDIISLGVLQMQFLNYSEK